MQLAVVNPANVLLLLGDIFSLRFPGLELLFVTFLPQPGIGLVIARVGSDPARVDLKDFVHDAVEKIAIVADDEHCLGLLGQILLQPARGINIEVVARLVQEHDIRRR